MTNKLLSSVLLASSLVLATPVLANTANTQNTGKTTAEQGQGQGQSQTKAKQSNKQTKNDATNDKKSSANTNTQAKKNNTASNTGATPAAKPKVKKENQANENMISLLTMRGTVAFKHVTVPYRVEMDMASALSNKEVQTVQSIVNESMQVTAAKYNFPYYVYSSEKSNVLKSNLVKCESHKRDAKFEGDFRNEFETRMENHSAKLNDRTRFQVYLSAPSTADIKKYEDLCK